MRKARYPVSVLAEERSSFEQNPPTLVEFIRRDLRWCQGNMQYWHFLRMPGLRPVSRYQLAFAILMFIGSPAWIAMLMIGSIAVALAPTPADFMRFRSEERRVGNGWSSRWGASRCNSEKE